MRTIATSAAVRTEFDIQCNQYKTIAETTIFGCNVKISFLHSTDHCAVPENFFIEQRLHSAMRIASLLDRLITEESYHTIGYYDILLAELKSVEAHHTSHITMNGTILDPVTLCEFVIEHGDPEARVVALEKLKALRVTFFTNGGIAL